MKPGKNFWDINISSNVSSKMRSYISLMDLMKHMVSLELKQVLLYP